MGDSVVLCRYSVNEWKQHPLVHFKTYDSCKFYQSMTLRCEFRQSELASYQRRYYEEDYTHSCSTTAIDRLSTVKKGYWPPLIIIGCVTYAPLSGVYECPWCSHGPRGPVGVYYECSEGCRAQNRNWRYVSLSCQTTA
jgi:hypothetical protein